MKWLKWPDTEPFPHAIQDDFVSLEQVRAINEQWPERGWQWHIHDYSRKRNCEQWEEMGRAARSVIGFCKSEGYMDVLRRFTDIADLVPDETLHGEGLHETQTGGFLDVHVDFNRHPGTGLYRRLNLLIFLNEGWKEEWGGCLELWDGRTGTLSKRITPEAGRAVLFETSDHSFHGHPIALAAPDGRPRRSLALYYYSATPADQAGDHSTLYVEKGQIA